MAETLGPIPTRDDGRIPGRLWSEIAFAVSQRRDVRPVDLAETNR